MRHHDPYAELLEILAGLGLRTRADDPGDASYGFPAPIALPNGERVWLAAPEPGLLASLDPERVGAVILDSLGYPRARWGLGSSLALFEGDQSCLNNDLALLFKDALRGAVGALYLNGCRFHAAAVPEASGVFVLVIDASDEADAKRKASKSARANELLRRVGGRLTMEQDIDRLCVAAVHEIASSADQAAVLVWVRREDHGFLALKASVGVNRQGVARMSVLDAHGSMTCAAEAVAATRRSFHVERPQDHVYTAELESRFCYLQPGAIRVLPLVVGDRLLGVLELVGRPGEDLFGENRELLLTIAEHLALALNGALMYQSMERLARTDTITGLANHGSMQEFLAQRVAEAERTEGGVGVIMLDVDHFREFNEMEGHDAGDDVLRLVAEAIQAEVRAYDLAARYGGDEFTVVLPGLDVDRTVQIAERIRERIAGIDVVCRDGRRLKVTSSLGCAAYPGSASEAATLLKAADEALYGAKRASRNRVEAFLGEYASTTQADTRDPRLERWFTPQDRESADRAERDAAPTLRRLAARAGLTRAQERTLRDLLWISVPYRRLVASGDVRHLDRMRQAPELGPLSPSLDALAERFDGTGPRSQVGAAIPLLARVLAVLLALIDEHGKPFVSDPGRFDPELVALVGEARDAA